MSVLPAAMVTHPRAEAKAAAVVLEDLVDGLLDD
jgi:hypothetical protein